MKFTKNTISFLLFSLLSISIIACNLGLQNTDSDDIVATPVFDHEPGSMFNSATTINVTCKTESAKIYYTLDGSIPTNKSFYYSDGIIISGQDNVYTITVKAFRGGMTESEVAVASYSIHYDNDVGSQVASVVIGLASGVYPQVPNTRTVTLSCSTPGADIYYTAVRDGLIPTLNWERLNPLRANEISTTKLYNGPFEVTIYEEGTIQWANKVKAIALKNGMRNSTLSQAHYRLEGYPTSDSLSPNLVTSFVSDTGYTTFLLTVRDPDGYADIKRMQLSIRVSNHGTTNPERNPDMLYFAYRPDQFEDNLVFDNNNNLASAGSYYYCGPYGANEIIEMEYYIVDVSQCSMVKEIGDMDGSGIAADSITFTFCIKPKASVIDAGSSLGDLSKIKRLYCWLQDATVYDLDPVTGDPMIDPVTGDPIVIRAAHDVVSEVGRWDQRP